MFILFINILYPTFITLGVKYLNIIFLYIITMPKLCDFETCRARATYGLNCDPLKCFEHKEDSMKLSSTICKCGNKVYYNLEGLKPKFCVSCKTLEMIYVKNKKCFCKTSQPSINFEGLKPEYCKNCMKEGMVNLVSKKCFCKLSYPSFNFEGLNPEYCASCRLDNMINVIHKMCFCGKSKPYFNFEGLKPEYCKNCIKEGMINLVSKKCFCKLSYPSFNYKGLTGKFCSKCKTNGMVNLNHDNCKADNCQTIGNKNYKGYCASCFQHLFPLDPLTFQIRCKTKEIAVRDFINTKFEGFYHDKPLWYNETACDCTTKRRIDHRKLINGTLLCIETDENQHKSYSKQDEEARYHDLFMAYGGKFIFIRFNPDKYKDENGKSSNPMLFNRLIVLEEEINKQIKRIENDENIDLLEVIELYYDKK
jgi:hypothetical protein